MANTFLDLPMPPGDGPGTPVDTAAMGKEKTIIVGGPFVGATVTVEVSMDDSNFHPLTTFSGAGKKVIDVACKSMRVNVLGRSAEPFSANADVGANSIGGTFINLTVPAGNGPGAPVDISALGNFTTTIAGGAFRDATLTVELSTDGNSYAPCYTFGHPGGLHIKEHIANFARVVVGGRTGNTFPFTPVVSMGATNDAAAGGVGATGEKFITSLAMGAGDSHVSATPLVVAQKEFNPLDFALNNATRSLKFRAVAANGGGAASTNVQLYNLTDGEVVATLNFTGPAPVLAEAVLTEGTGVGEINLVTSVYEVRIFVDAPDAVDDSIELGSAEIQITNTIN